MNVAANELLSLLKQALEAWGLPTGDYEHTAGALVWMQMYGLADSAQLAVQMQEIKNCIDNRAFLTIHEQTQEQVVELSISAESANKQSKNATHTHSLLLCGQAIHELSFAHTKRTSACVSQISNVSSPYAITKNLFDAANRGLYAAAWFQSNQHKGSYDLLVSQPEQAIAAVTSVKQHSDVPALWLAYAQSQESLESALSAHDIRLQHEQTANELNSSSINASEENCQQAINNGIAINADLWQNLMDIASGVLVENSEQSRRGAGA